MIMMIAPPGMRSSGSPGKLAAVGDLRPVDNFKLYPNHETSKHFPEFDNLLMWRTGQVLARVTHGVRGHSRLAPGESLLIGPAQTGPRPPVTPELPAWRPGRKRLRCVTMAEIVLRVRLISGEHLDVAYDEGGAAVG